MGLYTGSDSWINDVYQFEETDVVQGGPAGIDNKPLQDLADRTVYVKNRLGIISNFDGQVDKIGNSSYTPADQSKMIVAFGNGVNTLTIADASTLKHGAIIPITSYCNPGCVINVVASNGQLFYDLDGWRSAMYMHHKEHLILVALTNHFKVVHASGNFYCAGEEIKGRKELRNTIALKGQLLQRNQYPRLWEYVSSLSAEVTSEFYFWSFGLLYQGFFTTGDGSTTFRLPDERGMFERMIDSGRGIDVDRYSYTAGGYEKDANGPISIKPTIWTGTGVGRNGLADNGIGILGTNGDGGVVAGDYASSVNRPLARSTPLTTGGSETIVKNIGKLNLIRF